MTASVESVWSDRESGSPPMTRSGKAFIDNGESISEAYVSYMAPFVAIVLPTITTAAITFQVQAAPGAAFVDLFDENGEVGVASGTGGLAIKIPQLAGWYAFKIRSGTTGSPVNQGANRTFLVQVSDRS